MASSTISMRVAQAIVAAVMAEEGWSPQTPGVNRKVADELGVTAQQVSDAVHGRRGKISTLLTWLHHWRPDASLVLGSNPPQVLLKDPSELEARLKAMEFRKVLGDKNRVDTNRFLREQQARMQVLSARVDYYQRYAVGALAELLDWPEATVFAKLKEGEPGSPD